MKSVDDGFGEFGSTHSVQFQFLAGKEKVVMKVRIGSVYFSVRACECVWMLIAYLIY